MFTKLKLNKLKLYETSGKSIILLICLYDLKKFTLVSKNTRLPTMWYCLGVHVRKLLNLTSQLFI